MRKIIFIFSFLFSAFLSEAQLKFLADIDTNYITNGYYSDSTDFTELITNSKWQEEFLPAEYDQDFLNAAVCGYINQLRKKRSAKPLAFSKELYTICFNFLNYFSSQSFQYNSEKNEKYNKLAKKSAKKIHYPKGIIKTVIFRAPAVQYKTGEFYFDEEDETTSLKLFYGTKPVKKETESEKMPELKPVLTYTFQSFFSYFFKNNLKAKYNALIHSKQYSSLACYLLVEKNTVNKKRIPQVSCMCIFGADRLKEVSKAERASKNQKKLIK